MVAVVFAYECEDLGCRLGDVASGSEYCRDADGFEVFVIGGRNDAAYYHADLLAERETLCAHSHYYLSLI